MTTWKHTVLSNGCESLDIPFSFYCANFPTKLFICFHTRGRLTKSLMDFITPSPQVLLYLYHTLTSPAATVLTPSFGRVAGLCWVRRRARNRAVWDLNPRKSTINSYVLIDFFLSQRNTETDCIQEVIRSHNLTVKQKWSMDQTNFQFENIQLFRR